MKTKLIKKVVKGGVGHARWISGVCAGCPKNNQHKKENYLQYYQELQKLQGRQQWRAKRRNENAAREWKLKWKYGKGGGKIKVELVGENEQHWTAMDIIEIINVLNNCYYNKTIFLSLKRKKMQYITHKKE